MAQSRYDFVNLLFLHVFLVPSLPDPPSLLINMSILCVYLILNKFSHLVMSGTVFPPNEKDPTRAGVFHPT